MSEATRLLRALVRPGTPPSCPPPPDEPGDRPSLSVVTIVLNRREGIRRAMGCLRRQTTHDFEWVVWDGGSTDGTLDELAAADDLPLRWSSGPDHGLYDALNRGVGLTRGRWVHFLHSDDWFPDDLLARAMAVAESSGADFVHGDNTLHLENGGTMLLSGRQDWAHWRPGRFLPIRHTSVLARRDLYERIGLFRTDLAILSDLDWLWRAHAAGARSLHDPTLRSDMAAGGISTRRMALAEIEAAVLTARLRSVPPTVPLGFVLQATPGVKAARRWWSARRHG